MVPWLPPVRPVAAPGAVAVRALVPVAPGQPDEIAGAGHLHRGGLDPQPHLGAETAQHCQARGAVQLAERRERDADVRGVLPAEQRGLHHGRGERQRRVVAVDVQGGDGEQVPQDAPGPLVLPVRRQPVTEPLGVQRGVGRVQHPHGEGGAGHPGPFGQGEQWVAGQCRAHVQRAGQRVAAELRRAAGCQHGDVEPVLKPDRPGHPQPRQQPAVRRAAAQEHVLAGVDDERAAVERGSGAAQPRPGLQQRDGGPGLGQRDRRGDPGEAAADHCHAPWPSRGLDRGPGGGAHERCPLAGSSGRASERTATIAFSRGDSDSRPCSTAAGSAAMRSSSFR